MHRNRSEIKEILEESPCLCIHFFYIIQRTLGDRSVQERYLFYTPDTLISDDKEIEFIIGPGHIEKQEIGGPIEDEERIEYLTRYERKYRSMICDKDDRWYEQESYGEAKVEIYYPVTLEHELELLVWTKGIFESRKVYSMSIEGHKNTKD